MKAEMKVPAPTVADLFPKMALTGQRIAMVDMVVLVDTTFHSTVGVDGARVCLIESRRDIVSPCFLTTKQ